MLNDVRNRVMNVLKTISLYCFSASLGCCGICCDKTTPTNCPQNCDSIVWLENSCGVRLNLINGTFTRYLFIKVWFIVIFQKFTWMILWKQNSLFFDSVASIRNRMWWQTILSKMFYDDNDDVTFMRLIRPHWFMSLRAHFNISHLYWNFMIFVFNKHLCLFWLSVWF